MKRFGVLGVLAMLVPIAAISGPASASTSAVKVAPAQTTWTLQSTNQQLLSKIGGSYPTISGSTTQGITSKSISAGCVADATASGAPTQQQNFCKGVEARINQANKEKDLTRKINLVTSLDTGSDPTQGQQDIAQLADSDKVGVVFDFSNAAPTAALETAHIPYFGTFSACGKQSVSGFGAGNGVISCEALLSESGGKDYSYSNAIVKALAKYSKLPASKLRYAAVASNLGPLVEFAQAEASENKAAGVNVVNVTTSLPASSAQAADLSPYVQSVLAAKPNVIGMIFEDTALLTRMTGALFQAGYKGAILGVYSPSMLQNSTVAQEINGALDTTSGWGDPSFAGKYWATLNKEAKQLKVPDDYGFLQGWISADLYIQGVKAFQAKGKPLTEENLTNFLNNGWVYPGYGNVTAPTIFPYAKYGPPPCTALTKMDAATKSGVGVVDITCGAVIFQALG